MKQVTSKKIKMLTLLGVMWMLGLKLMFSDSGCFLSGEGIEK